MIFQEYIYTKIQSPIHCFVVQLYKRLYIFPFMILYFHSVFCFLSAFIETQYFAKTTSVLTTLIEKHTVQIPNISNLFIICFFIFIIRLSAKGTNAS